MNRAELTAAVKDYLNRPDMAASVVNSWYPMVEGVLNRSLRDHPRTFTRATQVQPLGDNLLTFPADMLQLVQLKTADTLWKQYPADAPVVVSNGFIARGDVAELFPTPEDDTTFLIDYHAALAPLDADEKTNWVSVYFTDVYLYGLLREAAVYLKDDARLAAWAGEFQRRTVELAAQGWNQNWSVSMRSA